MPYQPPLEVRQVAGQVRLLLGDLAYGEGAILQEAADELVTRVLVLVMAFRWGGIGPIPSEVSARIGPCWSSCTNWEITATGGDIHDRLFG
jgi:hypothetical protein